MTMPCRSESASLPVAIWKRPGSAVTVRIRPAIASGELQSIRILPSWSSVMNRHVASTSGLTTVRSRLCRSAISPQ
ncbi:hypothetical protein O973_03365 [Mycobacterium avium subsp. avium 11-4751]|nr:hypothetical protein O982_03945 [Mycobacterium avium 10-5581]ETB23572.1 hypothetical protein O973_03365 [Mycobacterium avium subsp. avium 11-4751]